MRSLRWPSIIAMFIFFLIILIILYLYSVCFRLFFANPIKSVCYAITDLLKYIRKYKNIPKKPFINVYVGLFGQGKTLSAVHDIIDFYHAYNDKIVYDDRVNEYVTQKVLVLSNVKINSIPYRPFTSLQQLINISKWRHITDKKKHVRTITVVLGDEFSVQMNSRNFSGKDKNISPLFLNTLLTSRHALIHGFYLTSQRFGHMDALLRQISTNVIECRKIWRFQTQYVFDAWEYEQAARPSDCRILYKAGFLVRNKDLESYDTLAVVQNLIKDTEQGQMMTAEEIREAIGSRTILPPKETKKKVRLRKPKFYKK